MSIIPNLCSINDCEKPAPGGRKGWCVMHYTRWRNYGDPTYTKYDRSIVGITTTPEYKVWVDMKARCYNPLAPGYENYGGRGIRVSEAWIKSFTIFFEHIGSKPEPSYSIERVDVNGNYEPGNVKWASKKEQANNRRSNIFFTIDGETKTLKQWCDLKGLNYKTVHARIKRGVPFLEAL